MQLILTKTLNFLSNYQSRKAIFITVLSALLLFVNLGITINAQIISKPKNAITEWELLPSFKFDTICFINTLTGDPYYVKLYKKEYAEFEPKLTPEVRKALANLKRVIKDERRLIISAAVSLYFSATDDETLEDMLLTLENSDTMKANLKKANFYNEEGWQVYLILRKDFKVVFRFLQKVRFYNYWKKNILPKVNKTIKEIESNLPKYDIISEVKKHTGKSFMSNKITVYLLHFNMPHGIRITGTRFINSIYWSFNILVATATHEMIHPPYKSDDKELINALASFKKDKFVMDKVLNHNPSFGYNTFEGYMNENITKAIDQIINEKFKVATDARKRFKHSDDGMHVFGAALYSVMKAEGFPKNNESLRQFLLRIIRTQKLSSGKVKSVYESFYANEKAESEAKNSSYEKKEVSYTNGNVKLAASTYIPKGNAPLPAVVIVHGSGTSSRSNAWTSAYANALAKRGIAVLYPDKRGSGKSTGNWLAATFLDLADDAIAGVKFLQNNPKIDKSRIGVIGFSQGGHIIPAAASRSKDIAFAISVSASTVPILEQTTDEIEKMAEREGLNQEQIKVVTDINRKAIYFSLTGKNFDKYIEALNKAKTSELKGKKSVEGFPTKPDHNAFKFGKTVGDYDPIPYWKKVNVPILFIYGGQDTQIRINKSINRIEETFGKSDYNYVIMLFHQNGHGIYREDLLDFISRWILDKGDT